VAAGTRQSNFELLRVLAMLAIVAGHLFTQGRVTAHAPPSAWLPCLLLGNGARVAVNLFALLGCWFLAAPRDPAAPPPRRTPGERWLGLWAQTLCWSAPLTLLAAAIRGGLPARELARGFLPVLGRPLWFASAWLLLLLLAPALRAALDAAPRACAAAAAGLLAALCVPATLGDLCGDFFADVLWFVALFLLAGLARRAPGPAVRVPKGAALALGLAVYAALAGTEWAVLLRDGPSAHPPAAYRLAARFLADFKSLPNLVCAASLFAFFARLDPRPRPWIDALARPAFGVYVAHQVPAFHPILWTQVVRCPDWYRSPLAPLWGLLAAVAVYAAAALLDEARRALVEPALVRSRPFRALAARLDRLLAAPR